jgi:penicillin amidase
VASRQSHPEAWKWGRVHSLVYTHSLARSPVLAPALNVGPVLVGGTLDSPQQTAWALDKPFQNKELWSVSYRHVVDTSNITAVWCTYGPGNSGHITSKWCVCMSLVMRTVIVQCRYDNLAREWPRGDYTLISVMGKDTRSAENLLLAPYTSTSSSA